MISGHVDDVSGPALNNWPISGTLITLEPNARLEHLMPAADRAFFYVLSGEVTIDGRDLRAGRSLGPTRCPRPRSRRLPWRRVTGTNRASSWPTAASRYANLSRWADPSS